MEQKSIQSYYRIDKVGRSRRRAPYQAAAAAADNDHKKTLTAMETSRPRKRARGSEDDDACQSGFPIGRTGGATYRKMNIGALETGPRCVSFTGRVSNFLHSAFERSSAEKPSGYFRICMKDDTGAISVKLWYADVVYSLHLGQLVSVWTNMISPCEIIPSNRHKGLLVTSIFPERDFHCYFQAEVENSSKRKECARPLGLDANGQLEGLMNLKTFTKGGFEATKAPKILVCVRGIGPKRKVSHGEATTDHIELSVFDETMEASVSMWGAYTDSVQEWSSSETILLLSNPGFKPDRPQKMSMNANTYVEVDPAFYDGDWLRKYAHCIMRRENVNPAFPMKVFDPSEMGSLVNKILFTLADLDEFVRAGPNEKYIGYLSVVIMELHFFKLHQRNQLCSGECVSKQCKQCGGDLALQLNPRLVGPLVDETGSITCGKIIWSDEAWKQLLGSSPKDFVATPPKMLKEMEHRMLYLRMSLLFGWSPVVGKLVVCSVSS